MKTLSFFVTLLVLATSEASLAADTVLHPGDKVAVTVYNHPELSVLTVTLDALGQASVPLAGVVGNSGETTSQLGAAIRTRLLPYVRKPAVDVQLLSQGQNIFVSGGPGGVLTYAPGETLSGALAQLRQPLTVTGADAQTSTNTNTDVVSSSLAYSAIDLHHVIILRDGADLPVVDASELAVTGSPGPLLHPDDTIKLSYKPIAVTVQGEVKRPGVAHLDSDQPLSDALLQAGGANEMGSSVKFVLIRSGVRKPIASSNAEYSAPAVPGDIVYVPHSVRVGVVGQVIKPGDVELRGDGSLLSALYYAGGPSKYGDIRHVAVIHEGQQTNFDVTRLTHGAPADNPQLSDGDTVFVPEGHKIDFSLLFQGIISATYLRFL